MPGESPLMRRLKIEQPIIQAPMAGGGDTPALVAAVSDAGGMGFIGAAYLTPDKIEETGHAVRAKTSKPFGINLFAPLPLPDSPRDFQPILQRLAPFYAELGLPAPSTPELLANSFAQQVEASLESGATAVSFTFGIPSAEVIDAIKARGMLLACTATTVEEGVAVEKAGGDAVVTQGAEAGGHRGTFTGDFHAAMVGTIALVPQVADAVRIPVIASGGIMDGRGIAAALVLGASAVQMGTAFLTCEEAGVPHAYKEAILNAREDQTRITRAFSGRPARGIANLFMTAFESAEAAETILPFPLQNNLTRPLRAAAAKQDRAEFLSLWAGQGVRLARRQSAADLMARLVQETSAAIERLQSTGTRSANAKVGEGK